MPRPVEAEEVTSDSRRGHGRECILRAQGWQKALGLWLKLPLAQGSLRGTEAQVGVTVRDPHGAACRGGVRLLGTGGCDASPVPQG